MRFLTLELIAWSGHICVASASRDRGEVVFAPHFPPGPDPSRTQTTTWTSADSTCFLRARLADETGHLCEEDGRHNMDITAFVHAPSSGLETRWRLSGRHFIQNSIDPLRWAKAEKRTHQPVNEPAVRRARAVGSSCVSNVLVKT